ncbi:MAG: PorP/SprF family type IX secretion system membrane protein [Saprospiraceae bacterium]|nr:PorP/SprF family type IX secretion system membrane protein [Saprospiraceae bacterium]MDZ4703623.1 PorP/SprF family type IX secretion system membrane protein [Saprospiraceae bacterium]
MKLFRLLLLIVIVNATGTLSAQDIHYSLYNMSPLTLNPALTGAFSGTARIGGIYRDQWASVISGKQFVTPSFYIDAPIFRGFGKKDWVGVGFTMFTDKAGSLSLQTAASLLSASYHLALNKKGTSILTLGLQGGSVQRRAKGVTDFVFEDEFETSVGGGGLGVNGSMDKAEGSASYLDFTAGLMLRAKLDDISAMELGVSYGHLTEPDYTLGAAMAGDEDAGKRPARITAHGRYDREINEKWSVSPTFLYQTTASANEFALQGWASNQINKDFRLNMGLGYRFGDAAQVLFGGDYKDLRVALSYDVNVSSLSAASNYQGGFELAAWYIIKIYRKPVIKERLLCPRF